MPDHPDLVIAHLSELYKHRQLIATAYNRGEVDYSDDPEGGRGISKLNQARILLPFKEGTYRLASSLTKHLDEALRVDRLYSMVGADVADLDRRLPDIADLVASAIFDGRPEDADRYIDEFDRAVFALSDSVTVALQFLRVLADNRFANVPTYAEKRAQNEFYLGRVESISQALGAIQSNDLLHTLEATPEGERMCETYRSQIVNHLPQWRAQLLDITEILRDYLFRTRQIQLLAKRMRAFELFLKRTPSFIPQEIEVFDDAPAWMRRAAGFSLVAHPCVQNPIQEEVFYDIAMSIPSAKPSVSPPPRLGALLPDEPGLKGDEVASTQPWQEALAAMLADLGDVPVSALAWKAQRRDLAHLDDDIWLLCLLHEGSLRRRRSADVSFDPITIDTELLCGNIYVTDLLLSKVC
ncbi:hypothetical protein KW842_26850 [Duganella sp. sic0402]|uniref:hypothetical protein n=1 Tax=Duganella sp. sic0402 TaxID=2854786 RepID=UPI001C482EDD|nr:hypothetical protein [Duganella sp. sic0402]MBV7539396.1 hypothetical protein [Duganella sp. sic0402]